VIGLGARISTQFASVAVGVGVVVLVRVGVDVVLVFVCRAVVSTDGRTSDGSKHDRYAKNASAKQNTSVNHFRHSFGVGPLFPIYLNLLHLHFATASKNGKNFLFFNYFGVCLKGFFSPRNGFLGLRR
jgi:hypothetical protein